MYQYVMLMSTSGDVSEDMRAVFETTHGPVVVATLHQTEREIVQLNDLVDTLRDWDALLTDADQLALRLHHVTLPKLDATGAIEYDRENHIIEPGESELIESVLDRL